MGHDWQPTTKDIPVNSVCAKCGKSYRWPTNPEERVLIPDELKLRNFIYRELGNAATHQLYTCEEIQHFRVLADVMGS
jgi:hypothetical protein